MPNTRAVGTKAALHRFGRAATAVAVLFSCLSLADRSASRTSPIPWLPGTTGRPSGRFSNWCGQPPTKSSPQFVPPAERIATFDQDGTLSGRASAIHASDVLPEPRRGIGRPQKPELRDTEPFKTVLSGDREAIAILAA